MPRDVAVAVLLAAVLPAAATADTEFNGHLKGRLLGDAYPDNSVFTSVAGDTGESGEIDLRLKFSARHEAWTFDADYQAFALSGDNVRIANALSLTGSPATVGVLDDRRRWFDLTATIRDSADSQLLHRLDRLSLTWTSDSTVLRFGRQALSWGGGLFFSPFDIVNPFDPAAVDTEYKTGDDMIYVQVLRDNGDDIQFAVVGRRNPVSGDLSARESTAAVKYHGIAGDREFDILVADNRDRTTVGLGGNIGVGGAVLRADLVAADDDGWVAEFVTSLSYSWTAWSRNMSGALEYYYNGWGLSGSRYGVADLADDPALAERLARGETFTLGRHYLAAGVTVELSPLWLLTPNLFANLGDKSALLQVVVQRSLGDNLSFLGAVNLSLGPDGSEFGGIRALPPQDAYYSRSAGLFAQLGWYF